jgi:ribosomal protein S1
MSKIKTQTIEIINPENPLESKKVVVPIRGGEKILCKEPYVLEAMKVYDSSFNIEDLNVIATYENNRYKGICTCYVNDFNDSSADISLSKKHSTTIDLSSKNTSSIKEEMEVGKSIEVVVTKEKGKLVADAASKSAQIERLRIELIKQIETPTSAYIGVVKDIVFNGAKVFNGFIVDINGVKCFMPGSESDVVPLEDYNTLVGQSLYVMPIAKVKESIVVSHKEFLNTKRDGVLNNLINTDKTSVTQGIVSSVKPFGVFILIEECVPTLLSVSEMNEITEDKFKNGQLKVGETIEFYVESVVNGRVTVTQTNSKSEGWNNLKEAVENDNKYILKGVIKNTFENGIVVSAPSFNNITFFLSRKVVDMDSVEIGKEVQFGVSNVDTVKKTVRIVTE